MKKDIQILLVDDHELVRHGLRHMLELEEDIEIVGDCASAEEVLPQVEALSPDIVLMDVRMPGTGGIEACRQLKEKHPTCNVIMLTLYDEYLPQAIEAGAAGYLLKNIKRKELAQVIREVYHLKNGHKENSGSGVFEEVELVIPPLANAAQLSRFISQLEEILRDEYARIIHTAGSQDWGTVMTILLQPPRLSALLHRLGNMLEVEKVEEEPVARGAFSGFRKEFGTLPRSSIGPGAKIVVSLK